MVLITNPLENYVMLLLCIYRSIGAQDGLSRSHCVAKKILTPSPFAAACTVIKCQVTALISTRGKTTALLWAAADIIIIDLLTIIFSLKNNNPITPQSSPPPPQPQRPAHKTCNCDKTTASNTWGKPHFSRLSPKSYFSETRHRILLRAAGGGGGSGGGGSLLLLLLLLLLGSLMRDL